MKVHIRVAVRFSLENVVSMLETSFHSWQQIRLWTGWEPDIGDILYLENSGGNVIGLSSGGHVFFEGRRAVVTNADQHSNMICAVWGYIKKRVERERLTVLSWKQFGESFEVLSMESWEPERPWYY